MPRGLVGIFCCLLACVNSAYAQPPDPPSPNEAMDPYAALSILIDAYNNNNWRAIRDLIQDAEHDDTALDKVGEEIKKARGTLNLSWRDYHLEENGNDATVSIIVSAENHMGLRIVWRESLRFHKVKYEVWRLRSGAANLVEWNAADGYLQRLLMLIAHPKIRAITLQSESAKQVKALILGVLQFIQDYDQKYDFTQTTFKKAIRPYIRSEEIWTAPGDAAGAQSYAFNPNLLGFNNGKIAEPNKTVMIYLGHDGRPDFRYDRKTVIGFADGHVEILDAEQAENLRWEP